jgi:Uma2 family endonuclease
MKITSLSQLDLTKTYSYADYFSWSFQERVELIKGKIFNMSPAPNRVHQTIVRDIAKQLLNFLDNNPCQVYFAPFDVRLERVKDDKKVQNVVQPDICVVCDLTKLDDRGCSGAPELVIEILSPGNTKKEMKYKFELYETAGVLEYWIVDPTERIVWQYNLENSQFINHKPLIDEDTLYSSVIPNFSIKLESIFQ